MPAKTISVRLMGSAAPLAEALDHARLQCIAGELSRLSPDDRTRTVERVCRRYAP